MKESLSINRINEIINHVFFDVCHKTGIASFSIIRRDTGELIFTSDIINDMPIFDISFINQDEYIISVQDTDVTSMIFDYDRLERISDGFYNLYCTSRQELKDVERQLTQIFD